MPYQLRRFRIVHYDEIVIMYSELENMEKVNAGE
jgi:hypothetical protein